MNVCIGFYFLGGEVPIINIVARNSRLPTDEGYVRFYNYNALFLPLEHRQRVESLILSSQISTDQQRVFLGGDTIKLTFNIGMVWPDMNILYACKYRCCSKIPLQEGYRCYYTSPRRSRGRV